MARRRKYRLHTRAVPTAFVGRITTESDKAIQLTDSAAASSIRKLAHRISQQEQNDSNDQKDWLNDRLAEHREEFNQRADAVSLDDEWLPKSAIQQAVKRRDCLPTEQGYTPLWQVKTMQRFLPRVFDPSERVIETAS